MSRSCLLGTVIKLKSRKRELNSFVVSNVVVAIVVVVVVVVFVVVVVVVVLPVVDGCVW